MELSATAIESIKEVRKHYEKRTRDADKAFIDEILAIINLEEKLKEQFQVFYDNKIIGPSAYVEFKEIHFNIRKYMKESLGRALVWLKQFKNIRVVDIQNLYAIYGIIHEVVHIYQTCGFYDDPELNRLYRDLFNVTEDMTFYQAYLYQRKGLSFSFERSALLNGFRETARIYDDSEYREVAEANYMFMIDDYGFASNPPLDFTLKVFKLQNNYDFSNLTELEKLEHGIMVGKDTLHLASDISTEYAKENITYDEGLEKLKKLK